MSTFAILANFTISLCDETYLLSHLMPAIATCINHTHQPSTSSLINLDKEAWSVPLATLGTKCPRSWLNDPLQILNTTSSIHAWME